MWRTSVVVAMYVCTHACNKHTCTHTYTCTNLHLTGPNNSLRSLPPWRGKNNHNWVCFTYIFACVHEPVAMFSPAARMRSAVRIRPVCGASAQSTPPAERREPSARVRVTAGLTSAVPSNQVSPAVASTEHGLEHQRFWYPNALQRVNLEAFLA